MATTTRTTTCLRTQWATKYEKHSSSHENALGLQISSLSKARAGEAARSLPALALRPLQRPEGRGDEEIQRRAQVDIADEVQEARAGRPQTQQGTPDSLQPNRPERRRPRPPIVQELLRRACEVPEMEEGAQVQFADIPAVRVQADP